MVGGRHASRSFVPDPATGSGTDTGRPSADAYRLGFPAGRAAGRRAGRRGAMAVRPCRNTRARGISDRSCPTAFLTGALHEDGLADLADGFAAERKSGKSRSCGIAVSALWSTGCCYRTGIKAACLANLAIVAPWLAAVGLMAAHSGAHGDPANRLLSRPGDRHRASGAGRAKPVTTGLCLAFGTVLSFAPLPGIGFIAALAATAFAGGGAACSRKGRLAAIPAMCSVAQNRPSNAAFCLYSLWFPPALPVSAGPHDASDPLAFTAPRPG